MTIEQDTLFRLIDACRKMSVDPKCNFGENSEYFLGLLAVMSDDFATRQYLVNRTVLEGARVVADDGSKNVLPDKDASVKVVQSIDSILTNPEMGWGTVTPT